MAKIAEPRPAGPTDVGRLAAFERHIGQALPAECREFLLAHNGGRPVPDPFTLAVGNREPEENVVMCFFPLRDLSLGAVEVETLDDLRIWPLHCAWDDLQADLESLYQTTLDPPLLPIGTDGSCNYISLVLAGDRVGAVMFLDHETAEAWPLAPSVSAFLDSLRPRKRTDYHDLLGSGE